MIRYTYGNRWEQAKRKARLMSVERLRRSALLARFSKASFWTLAGATGLRGLNLAAFLMLGRFLGDVGLGKFGMVQSTMGLFLPISTISLNVALSKHVAQYYQSDAQKTLDLINAGLGLCLLASLVLGGIGFVGAEALSPILFNASDMATPLRIGCVTFVAFSLNIVLESIFNGYESFRANAGIKFVKGICGLLTITVGCRLGQLNGALLGLLAMEVVMTLGYGVALWKMQVRRTTAVLSSPIRSIKRYSGVLLRFGVPLLIGGLVIAPALWSNKRLLAAMPGGYASLGLFNAAEKWYQLALFIPSSLSLFVLPVLSNLRANNDSSGYRRFLLLGIGLNIAVASGISCAILFLSPIMVGLFGQGFANARTTLNILVLASLGTVSNTLLGHHFVSRGHVVARMVCDLALALLMLASSLYFVPLYRENGVAITYVVSYTGVSLLLAGWILVDALRGRLPRFNP